MRRVGLERHDTRKILNRLVEILLRPVHCPSIREGLRIRRVGPDGQIEVLQRPVVVKQRNVRDASAGMGNCQIAAAETPGLNERRAQADGDLGIGIAASRLSSYARGQQRRYKY